MSRFSSFWDTKTCFSTQSSSLVNEMLIMKEVKRKKDENISERSVLNLEINRTEPN